jgi:hypothetical protein
MPEHKKSKEKKYRAKKVQGTHNHFQQKTAKMAEYYDCVGLALHH